MKLACRTVSRGLVAASLAAGLIAVPTLSHASSSGHHGGGRYFERIATIPAYLNTDVGGETVSEIVTVSEDKETLIYTDAAQGVIGFVDIADPYAPAPTGAVDVGGEPTSVAVKGGYALAAVNTSDGNYVNPTGVLQIVDIASRAIERTLDLGGQPDSIAVSPDGRYAAIAIENERDEDYEPTDGAPPQAPPGFLVIVDLVGGPASWSTRTVELVGIPALFPEDPEPEFVSINSDNVAVVTLQENNHIVLVNLRTGQVIRDFPAGTVDLTQIDTLENDLIEQTSSLDAVPREPDGVVWLPFGRFATADEGDLYGGSRGFTIYDALGRVLYSSRSTVEHLVARIGHYPEARSENKGAEPEGVAYGRYGRDDLLFVGTERASVVGVYELAGRSPRPKLLQVLAAGGVGPEGLLAIPERDLFVVASETDSRDDVIRAGLSIYKRGARHPDYPTIYSKNRPGTTLPIPWAALSGLAVDPHRPDEGWTVHDSFYRQSRIFRLDLSCKPAKITREIVLRDCNNLLPDSVKDEGDFANLDLEGISLRPRGGWWVVSEGAGTVGDEDRPFETPNLLIAVAKDGCIEDVVELPEETAALQVRFGFEGVASVTHRHGRRCGHRGYRGRGGHTSQEYVYVAFQREWTGDPKDRVRIGRYDVKDGEWAFYYYPLDTRESPNGGWVGLSEIVDLGDERLAVIERDNQGNTDAAIKRIYTFSVKGLEPKPEGGSFPVVEKELARDILPDLQALNGFVLEKIESLAVLPGGTALIVNDNDGVDDHNGETQLLRIPGVF